MSKDLIFYCNVPILHDDVQLRQVPGIEDFRVFAKYFDVNVSLNDRSNIIKFPFRMKSSSIPVFDKDFNISYRDCAGLRMSNLNDMHSRTGKKFRLLYSGGVDSSAIFASFIEYYGIDKARNLLELSCSKESIDENPWLWDQYIRKYNFDIISSHDHGNQWADNKIIVMGEGNDQLFGKTIDYAYHKENKTSSVTYEDVLKYLNNKSQTSANRKLASILFKLKESAPFEITNMFTFLWWCSFTLTWDGISHRVLSQAMHTQLPADTLDSGLVQFYNTVEFQKWSMKYYYNCDFERELPKEYRYACKQMTMDILNIPEYKDKRKFTSFPRLHSLRPTAYLIDTELNLYRNTSDYLNFIQTDNSFV